MHSNPFISGVTCWASNSCLVLKRRGDPVLRLGPHATRTGISRCLACCSDGLPISRAVKLPQCSTHAGQATPPDTRQATATKFTLARRVVVVRGLHTYHNIIVLHQFTRCWIPEASIHQIPTQASRDDRARGAQVAGSTTCTLWRRRGDTKTLRPNTKTAHAFPLHG